jgi:hypothetical protein
VISSRFKVGNGSKPFGHDQIVWLCSELRHEAPDFAARSNQGKINRGAGKNTDELINQRTCTVLPEVIFPIGRDGFPEAPPEHNPHMRNFLDP